MPLRITLKPLERLIINGAAIRNGDRSSSFVIETQCRFLRESEIVHERDADTSCKKLCVTLQVIYLSDDPSPATELFYAQANEILRAIPSAAPFLLAIQQELEAERFHHAIKRGRELIAHEANLLQQASSKSDAA